LLTATWGLLSNAKLDFIQQKCPFLKNKIIFLRFSKQFFELLEFQITIIRKFASIFEADLKPQEIYI